MVAGPGVDVRLPSQVTSPPATVPVRRAFFFQEANCEGRNPHTRKATRSSSEEIEYLSNDKRREVAERIRVAREFGDIAENAEYDDAKNEQALLEHRIAHARGAACAMRA